MILKTRFKIESADRDILFRNSKERREVELIEGLWNREEIRAPPLLSWTSGGEQKADIVLKDTYSGTICEAEVSSKQSLWDRLTCHPKVCEQR